MCAIGTEEGTFQILPWIWSAGGDINDLTSEGSVKAIQFLTDLVQNGYMRQGSCKLAAVRLHTMLSAQRKAAMFESGTWQLQDIDEKINGTFNYEYALLPMDQQYASCIARKLWCLHRYRIYKTNV